jgi:hypothetical protein
MQKLSTEIFNLKKPYEVEGKELFQLKISNTYAALENLNDDVEIIRDEILKENTKISAKESSSCYKQKQHKPQFDKECSKLLNPREQASNF